MKHKEFTYTDAKGKITQRSIIVVQEPSQLESGIDTSEMSDVEFAEFVLDYKALRDQQQLELMELYAYYDLQKRFRNFTASQMTNVVVEHV